jgi:3-hydroxymyristoyl/3-hydroxydecanoyl-(acyl carrier protein) dehydratase
MADPISEILTVTVENGHCEGHFPGHPIVPAAAQVQWTLAALERELGAGSGWELRQGKFLRELTPGHTVELRLSPDKRGWRVQVVDAGRPYADMLWVPL